MQNQILGQQAEQFVCQHLQRLGKKIVVRNYRQRCGEIDIIAADSTTVYFVEVKVRKNPLFSLAELIPHTKQRKIIKTAHHYITQAQITNKICQFDAALVELKGNEFELTYIPNAFMPADFNE
jgi:putative endonuclease